jgi:DNA-binding HxlR family transcriptional regulator
MPVESKKSLDAASKNGALVRAILARGADKWTLRDRRARRPERRAILRLRERIGGVSQKMLTKRLRQIERDGLVTRRVHAEVPPRVDYRLTPLGESLGQSVCGVWTWVEAHMQDVERSRRSYDTSATRPSSSSPNRTLTCYPNPLHRNGD